MAITKVAGGKPGTGRQGQDPKSGRVMECLTTQPGVQLYTGTSWMAKQWGSAATNTKSTSAVPGKPSIIRFTKPIRSSIDDAAAWGDYHQETVYKFSAGVSFFFLSDLTDRKRGFLRFGRAPQDWSEPTESD